MSLPNEGADSPRDREQELFFDAAEVVDALREQVYNGKPVHWSGLADFPNLTPLQAAIAARGMDPFLWPDGTRNAQGETLPEFREQIVRLEQSLRGKRAQWSLRELVELLGDRAPLGMRYAIEAIEPAEQRKERMNAAGFYTLDEAAQALGAQEGWHSGTRQTFVTRMREAVHDGKLTVRDTHTNLPYRPSVVRDWYELVTPADVNAWLASWVGYRWNTPAVEPEIPLKGGAGNEDHEPPTVTTHRLSGRPDFLRPAIQRAIEEAGSREPAAVFVELREMALNQEAPFTGKVNEKGLDYTDRHNKVCTFTLDALRKRLNPAARGKKPAR